MSNRRRILSILFLAGVVAFAGIAAAKKSLAVKTTVTDFVTTKWTIDCPDGTTIDLGTESLSEEGWMELTAALADIESENGFSISSKTVVKNGVAESDQIDSEVVLTEEQATLLCGIVEKNRIPPAATFRGRPAIRTVTHDGVVEAYVIDLGDGRVIDLTDLELDPQFLQQLSNLIQQFEMENGVHTTSATGTKGGTVEGDRVISLTHLTAAQVEQILQLFAMNQIAIPPQTAHLHVRATAVVKTPNGKAKVDLEGSLLFSRQPAPGGGGLMLEILDGELRGDSTAGPVVLRPHPSRPGNGQIGPVSPGAKRAPLSMDVPFVVQVPDLGLDSETTDPVGIAGKFPFVPKRAAVRMKAKGKHTLAVVTKRDRPPSLKIKRISFVLPLRAEVIPGGLAPPAEER